MHKQERSLLSLWLLALLTLWRMSSLLHTSSETTSASSSEHVSSSSASTSHASHHHLHHGHHRVVHTTSSTSTRKVFALLLHRELPPFEETAVLLKSILCTIFCFEFYIAEAKRLMRYLITANRYHIYFSTVTKMLLDF